MTISRETIKEFILLKVRQRAELLGLIFDNSEGNTISDEQSLTEIGIFDSISFLDLLAEMERNFNVRIELGEHDPEYFTTLNGLATIVGLSDGKLSVNNAQESTINSLKYEEIFPESAHWNKLGELFRDMYLDFAGLGMKLSLKKDGAQIWLRSLLGSIGKTNHIIGCIYGGKLVAFIQASVKLLPAYLEASPLIGFVAHIYVVPECRNHGIARELVNKANTWFEQQRADSIELQVLVDNKPAMEFWKKIGFSPELLQMRKIDRRVYE